MLSQLCYNDYLSVEISFLNKEIAENALIFAMHFLQSYTIDYTLDISHAMVCKQEANKPKSITKASNADWQERTVCLFRLPRMHHTTFLHEVERH